MNSGSTRYGQSQRASTVALSGEDLRTRDLLYRRKKRERKKSGKPLLGHEDHKHSPSDYNHGGPASRIRQRSIVTREATRRNHSPAGRPWYVWVLGEVSEREGEGGVRGMRSGEDGGAIELQRWPRVMSLLSTISRQSPDFPLYPTVAHWIGLISPSGGTGCTTS